MATTAKDIKNDERHSQRNALHGGCAAPGSLALAVADLDEIYSRTAYLSVPLLNDITQAALAGSSPGPGAVGFGWP
jgi:hypothetical protein